MANIKGRLHFNDCPRGAPFPSMLIHINQFTTFGFYYLITQEELLKL